MNTYIVLLRGVMPVGKNKVPMATLRTVLAENGFANVRTYIASGNVLVDTELSRQETAQQVHDLILKAIGPDLAIVVRTGSELQRVLDENPFDDNRDQSRIFYTLFTEQPDQAAITTLTAQDFTPEELVITDHAAYMYIPGTYGRGTLSNNYLEKKLAVAATTRNANTLRKLIALSAIHTAS